MLDIGVSNQNSENSSNEWPLEDFAERIHRKESNQVIRKFINSAIYVEKPVASAISSENTSISQKFSNEDLLEPKTKRCTCSVDQKTCPCHSDSFFNFIPKDARKSTATTKILGNKTKISQAYVTSNNTNNEKELFKDWVTKKEEEKKKKEIKAKKAIEVKMKEKEILLEKERNNFKKWLMNKKKTEMEAKKKKEKELEEQQLKELEKEKRQLENQLNFQLWLKKKEEANLEKKIKKQMELINDLERKEIQLKENEKAFNEWLQSSKHKQKPVPLNRGIESLCSSTSVTYVNPNPWNPIS